MAHRKIYRTSLEASDASVGLQGALPVISPFPPTLRAAWGVCGQDLGVVEFGN